MQTDKNLAPFGVSSYSLPLVITWFGATFTTLLFSALFLLHLSTTRIIIQHNQNFKLYAALPAQNIEVFESVVETDGRSKIIESFFKSYNAPLASFSEDFVRVADEYKIDYRLLPAISMQESNGGRKVIENSNNPFGYGIYGGKVMKFASFKEAIERAGKGLREDYLNIGLNTPAKIMPKYTPPSIALGGPWAKGVSTFMEELR